MDYQNKADFPFRKGGLVKRSEKVFYGLHNPPEAFAPLPKGFKIEIFPPHTKDCRCRKCKTQNGTK